MLIEFEPGDGVVMKIFKVILNIIAFVFVILAALISAIFGLAKKS